MRRHFWVVALLSLAAACNGTSKTATTPSISSTSSDSPTTTSAPVVTTTPTTVPEPIQTVCTEQSTTSPRFEFADESALDAFAPLSATPSLRLMLNLGDDPQSLVVSTARIPGGILLSANAVPPERSLLTAIDATGETRWTRCFDDSFNAFVGSPASATQALVLVYVSSINGVVPDWRIIDLATGATVASLDALLAEQGVATDGIEGWMLTMSTRSVLFGPPFDSTIDIARDHLVLVDFAEWTAESIPFPASVDGKERFEVEFTFTEADEVALVNYVNGIANPKAVYLDGAWTADPSAFRTPSIRVGEATGDDGISFLIGLDPTGAEVWRVSGLSLPFGEGFRHAPSGDVTVMAGCSSFVDFACEPVMAGIDTATGDVLWTSADFGDVLALGDGLALVTRMVAADGSTSRIMIDTTTGELADPSQQWSPNDYYQGCCGDESHWVAHFGGMFVAAVDNVIDVWYPADIAPPTRAVPIP